MNKVYEIVTNEIIKKIEDSIKEGKDFQWIKPWTSQTVPRNFVSKKNYTGINLLLLPYPGYYMTFKQIQENKKIKLQKGAKSNLVVFWTMQEKEIEKEVVNAFGEREIKKEKHQQPVLRYYRVFNEKFIENFDEIKPVVNNEFDPIEKADHIIENWSKECQIIEKDINTACYMSDQDKIIVPPKKCFKKSESFYSTVFHEMIHSTGAKTRLNRKGFEKGVVFGDCDYSKEELIAEIGSQFLLAKCNIQSTQEMNNSIAYLQSWLKQLQNDATLVVSAAQQAQKAVNLIAS